jgi:hypothetical protein
LVSPSLSVSEIQKSPQPYNLVQPAVELQIGGSAPYDSLACPPSTGIQYADGQINQGPQAPQLFDSTVAEVSTNIDPVISVPTDAPDFKLRSDMVLQKGGHATLGHATLGHAPVNSLGKDPIPIKHNIEEIWPKSQMGGQSLNPAPIESLGKDPIPIKHDIEEVWPEPQQGGQVKGILKKPHQTGGSLEGAPIAETLGTDIDQATFSMPAMATEPYVVANPYVSPPMLPSEVSAVAPNQAIINQAPVTQTDAVSTNIVSEVLQTVQQGGASNKNIIFENSEIRVVKLE